MPYAQENVQLRYCAHLRSGCLRLSKHQPKFLGLKYQDLNQFNGFIYSIYNTVAVGRFVFSEATRNPEGKVVINVCGVSMILGMCTATFLEASDTKEVERFLIKRCLVRQECLFLTMRGRFKAILIIAKIQIFYY